MAKNIKVGMDGFEEAMKKILEDFQNNTTDMLKAETELAAKYGRTEVKNNASKIPVGSGTYAHIGLIDKGEYIKSWAVTKTYEDSDEVRYVIHNKKHYRLTHLLEKGHVKVLWGIRTDGRVPAYPHIGPAENELEKYFVNRVKTRLTFHDY